MQVQQLSCLSSHSYQGCNLPTVQRTQFREISQDSGGKHRPNSGYALEQIVFLLPDGALPDALTQVMTWYPRGSVALTSNSVWIQNGNSLLRTVVCRCSSRS